MKKAIAKILIFMILIHTFMLSSIAQDKEYDFTESQKESIYNRYMSNKYMFDGILDSSDGFAYWTMINDSKQDKIWSKLVEMSSKILDVYLTEQDYVEILTSLIFLQSGDIAEQVQNQSKYDDLKTTKDYLIDTVEDVAMMLGGSDFYKEVSDLAGTTIDFGKLVIDNEEQSKFYETVFRDYSQSKLFLEAISKYAENEKLKNAAKLLLQVKDELFLQQIEYLRYTGVETAKFEAKCFIENMSVDLLKDTKLYKSNKLVKLAGGFLENILEAKSLAELSYKLTLLVGNIGLGTENTFKRYEEMKAIACISEAIAEANRHVKVSETDFDIDDIHTKCEYFKMLITTNARGEYLCYQLLSKDANLYSSYKMSKEDIRGKFNTDEWYNNQIQVLKECYDILENMFEIEEKKVISNIPSDAVEFNGHYYKVIQDDTITNWEAALQYCNSQNGYLATITSQEENDFLYSYIKQAGYESAYFGLSDAVSEGTWTWANGESVTYTNWHENEPNGESSSEDYALFYYKYSDGTWNDGDFSNRTVNGGTAFICEWEDYESVSVDEDVYATYRDAAKKTTASGNWQEHLNMTASMNLASEDGKEKAKANVTMEANANVQDYDETDLSKLKISGDAYIQVGGQKSAWTMTYADGTAHYQYTEPNEYSTDLTIDPVYFEFSDMTSDMMQNAEISDGKIKFTVSGDQMAEVTQETVNMMGVDAIEYETGEIEIQINDETATIDHINMTVHASMRYMGYNAEVDYLIKYNFTPGTMQNDEGKQTNSADLYKDIFQQYVSAIRYYDGCSDEELASRYPDVNAFLVNSNQKDGSRIWYAYYDIDGNGIEELLWGYETISGIEWKLVDVFTYDLEKNQVVNLGNNELFSEYSGSFIYENGVICILHGEQVGFYRMNSAGSQIELFNEYTKIGQYPDIYYFNDQERLNEEGMNELRKQQGNEIAADWILFNPDEMDTDIPVENDVKYEYSTGEFLSEFSVTGNRATLSFWHNYGGSSSDEDFSFEWNAGQNEYEVQGQRSKKMFRLTFAENGNEMKITVTCIEGDTYSWTSGEKSNMWVDAVYTKK